MDARRDAAFDLEELAARVDLRASTVGEVESGVRDVDLVTLVRLSLALGRTAASVVERIPPAIYERRSPRSSRPVARSSLVTGYVSSDPGSVLERFGRVLRDYRRAHLERPVDWIARDAGVTASTILKLERGRFNPKATLACHVADACEVELSTLLVLADL